ncbi:MAG: S9 family peptidase, partial [Tannerellaceae bacterium]
MPIQYQFAIKILGENNTPDIKVCFVPNQRFEKTLVSITTNAERPLTVNDIIEGKRIGSMSLSPNGQYALINYSQVLPGGETQRYTELKDITSNRVILSDPRQSVSYSWMPKSNKLYYTRKGIVGTELVTVDPATLSETVLSSNLPEGSFRFAPNESFLLLSIVEKGPTNDGAMQEILTPADRQPGWRNRYFIHKFDLNTGNLQRLTYGYKTTAL